MKILYMGCKRNGQNSANPEDTVIGVDSKKFPDVDVVHDMEMAPLPFENESFDVVYSNHNLEHVVNRAQLVEEIWRILKPGGIFDVTVPHHSNPVGKRLDHHGCFSMQSFDSLVPQDREKYENRRFSVAERHIRLLRPFGFLEPVVDRCPDFYEWRLSALVPAVEVRFKLKKV